MKLFKPIILIAAALFALVLLAELVVRLAFPVPMEPGATLTLKNDMEGIKGTVAFRFDGNNLRKIGWSRARKSDNLRILCVGGNGTISLLQSAEDAWWGVLAGQLGKRLDQQVEIAAVAHLPDGRITSGLARTEKLLEIYEVDLIICCFGFGDAYGTAGDYRYDRDRLERLRASSRSKGFKYKLAKISHLLRLVRNSRTSKGYRARQAQIGAPNYYRDLLRGANAFYLARQPVSSFGRTGDDPLEEFIDGIEGFIDLAKRSGSKLLVLGEPTIYKSELGPAEMRRVTVPFRPVKDARPEDTVRILPSEVERELQRFYKEAQAKCTQGGVQWLNLQGEIPRYADYFVTETYLTDKGCAAVAAELVEPVEQLLRP